MALNHDLTSESIQELLQDEQDDSLHFYFDVQAVEYGQQEQAQKEWRREATRCGLTKLWAHG